MNEPTDRFVLCLQARKPESQWPLLGLTDYLKTTDWTLAWFRTEKAGSVPPAERPVLVTLCGSTRFKEAFIEANYRETMAGRIVLTVGWFSHADGHIYTPTAEEKKALDQLHFRKIEASDEILVLNVQGYIGESTRNEIAHALALGKRIRYLEPVDPGQ